MNTKPNILIFSVFEAGVSPDLNDINHKATIKYLKAKAVPYNEVKGRYGGIDETSFLVDFKHRNVVEELCKQFKQDSYLESHGNDRSANLVYPSVKAYGSVKREALGYLVAVSKEVAEARNAYTYNPATDTYYVTEKR